MIQMKTRHELVENALTREPGGIIARCTCGWSSGPRFSSFVASSLFMDHRNRMNENRDAETELFLRAVVPDELVPRWLNLLESFTTLHPASRFEVLGDLGDVLSDALVAMKRPGFSFDKIADRESLYDIAREVCHYHGVDWTDPRTGKQWPAAKPPTPPAIP
jgi:hypothetical protein